MRQRMTMLVALSSAMTLWLPITAPAQAAEVCAGQGTAQLVGGSFYYPVVGENSEAAVTTGTVRATLTPRSSGFILHLSAGTCIPSAAQFSASGTVHGWCGLSFGSGTTSFGQPFHWMGVGSLLVLTGGAVGVVNITAPNILAGDNCEMSPGANDFFVTGAVVTTDCSVAPIGTSSLSTSVPIPANSTSTSPAPANAHMTTGGHLLVQYTLCAGT